LPNIYRKAKLAYTANIIAAKIQKTATIPLRSIQGMTANPTPNETKFLNPLKSLNKEVSKAEK
jgi:hypothetical protein